MVSDAAPDVPNIPCPRILPLINPPFKGFPEGFDVLNASMLHDIWGIIGNIPLGRPIMIRLPERRNDAGQLDRRDGVNGRYPHLHSVSCVATVF